MSLLTVENPVFAAYAAAAALIGLRLMTPGGAAVVLMVRSDAGLLDPEHVHPRLPRHRLIAAALPRVWRPSSCSAGWPTPPRGATKSAATFFPVGSIVAS